MNLRKNNPTLLWRALVLTAILVTLGAAAGWAGVRAQEAHDSPVPAAVMLSPVARPIAVEEAPSVEVSVPKRSEAGSSAANTTSSNLYLPILQNDYSPTVAQKLGFGSASRSISAYPAIRSLMAGWYVNWSVAVNPARPGGIQFVQMVRLHQNLTCAFGTTADRTICPYVSPPSYTMNPARSVVERAARANPGSIWLIGNEMDRPDWFGGRQDEMTPELYAVAYNDLYTIIKSADPTAKLAIGGVIQFTPLRKQYLDTVWDTYRQRYGKNIPVDIWNVHNFIGSEICEVSENAKGQQERFCYGMAVPPGGTVDSGAYVGQDNKHTDRNVFEAQIRGFRQWMVDHGQKNKPLIVSEYGVLYPSLCGDSVYPTAELKQQCIDAWNQAGGYVNYEDPAVVHEFMLWTFNFFADTKDCELSGVDQCRLVQRWAWFGLEDVGWSFNEYGALFERFTLEISEAGILYSQWAQSRWKDIQFAK